MSYRALGDTRPHYTNPASVTATHTDNRAPAYGRNATGYGPKIPTRHRLTFTDGRTRRVYVAQYGNSGSAYVVIDDTPHHLDTDTEHALTNA